MLDRAKPRQNRIRALIVILVIILGLVKRLGVQNRGHNLAAQIRLGLGNGGLCNGALCGIRNKNRTPVTLSTVTKLTPRIGNINGPQKLVQQRLAANLARIKGDLDRLIMPGAALAHLLIGGVRRLAAGVTRHNRFHPGNGFKIRLDAPKTSARNDQCIGPRRAMLRKPSQNNHHCQNNRLRISHTVILHKLVANCALLPGSPTPDIGFHATVKPRDLVFPLLKIPPIVRQKGRMHMTDHVTTHAAAEDARNEDILIYLNGKIVPKAHALVSVYDSGFMLGDGIWEGIRLYNGKWAFLDEHMDRLFEASLAIDLDIGLTRDEMIRAIIDTQTANGMTTDAHARVMVTRGTKVRPFQHPSLSQSGPTIAIIMEHSKPKIPRPIRLATVPHLRGLPMTQDPKLNSHSKLNCILACIAAEKAGADEALMLDIHGFVNTTNACNFFIVRKGAVWTSTGDYCMNGITRQKVIDLCRANDIPVFERNFSLVDTYGADEAFLTGTFGAQTPVGALDGRVIGSGEMGPMTARLRDLYKSLIEKECA